jgi:hypothetical protein
MTTYHISVDGCDSSTIVDMEFTEDELALILRLRDRVNTVSDHGCQPTMTVYVDDENDGGWNKLP